MTISNEKRLCVAIYTPMVGGLYYSELTTQIIQLCEIKRYTVKVIRTGGYGEYTSKIGLAEVDIILLLRNAVHVNWVRDVRESGKPVVSISYDYFPLDVPVVVSDHTYGIKLAMEELRKSGCSTFSFIGNLNSYDIRKRYESFCEYLEDEGETPTESDIIRVREDLLGGGYEAAVNFVKGKCSAKGLIFGTTMNAIGFCKYLSDLDPELLKTLSIVSFDAHSMVPVLHPSISTIDQNYNLIAYKALSLGEEIRQGKFVEIRNSVKPKLISKESEVFNSTDAYMAISSEAHELYDPNYMKCVLYNMQEWVDIIAKSNFDELMILRPLFKGDLELATFGRFVNAGTEKKYFKVQKAIFPDEVISYPPQDKESLYRENDFVTQKPALGHDNFDKTLHLMINRNGEHWGLLSIYGYFGKGAEKSSYVSLVMYLEWVLTLTSPLASPKAETEGVQDANESVQFKKMAMEGKIFWNSHANVYQWDDSALLILGFETELDRGIYSTMDVTDRLLKTEIPLLRAKIETKGEGAFELKVHYRHRNREYIECELSSRNLAGDGTIEFLLRCND